MKSLFCVLIVSINIFSHSAARRGTFHRNRCNKTVDIYEQVSSPPVKDRVLGQPITCTYHLNPFPKKNSEWAITLRFEKFKVGSLVNGTVCSGGYLQILDGRNLTTAVARGPHSGVGGAGGYFCGEIETSKEYTSESDELYIIFHADNYDEQSYFLFESRAEKQKEIYIRFGPRPELFPNRRGQTVDDTFCDKTFTDCKRESCYVQSPGFPGVYLPNLSCQYHLEAADAGFVRLDMTTSIDFMVDGMRCEDIMICPPKPFTANDCNHDYIRVFDGDSPSAPVIGTFCGMDRVPFSIVGSTNRMLVEFKTGANASLLNTGFNFEVAPLIGSPLIGSWEMPGRKAGLCNWVFTSEDLEKSGDSEGVFMSLTHWHKPGTRCTYKITGREDEVVRMYFLSLRIGMTNAPIIPPMGQCTESLTIYDSDTADPPKLVKTFCNSFSVPLEKVDFVSTHNSLFVEFESLVGSYEGSSIDFWAHYDFFNNSHYGNPVHGTLCDEIFQESRMGNGEFGSPINTLVYTHGPDDDSSLITCTLNFQLDIGLRKRIELQIDQLAFGKSDLPCPASASACLSAPRDKIYINDDANEKILSCLCEEHTTAKPPIFIYSSGRKLELVFTVNEKHARANYFRLNTPVFHGKFSFVHDSKCGPETYPPTPEGRLIFPQFADPQDIVLSDAPDEVRVCVWDIRVNPERNLWLHFNEINLTINDCEIEVLKIELPRSEESLAVFCRNRTTVDMPVVPVDALKSHGGRVNVIFKTLMRSKSTFSLSWTELYPYGMVSQKTEQ